MDGTVDPKLTHAVIGCAYQVYNTLGTGYREAYYQRALAEEFLHKSISFRREVKTPLYYHKKIIGQYFIDFIVENKLVIELKAHDSVRNKDLAQILGYLKRTQLTLGLLLLFGSDGVVVKRVILSSDL
ncbi:MAG: GxxExxY protein [Candidatus Jacksonbacteria bacterium]|jgi:GxxExxY protein|nr:GxxExxY protein [Candidatus Jacksonbacteria bacterium]MBT6034252.1 GxxExxY protein [Candidatus Jacksonbacteria bacterium]MBT6301338.1 GxxExxY protein [Candidatus Jacksonbacteria bacterium]MBT6756980.1 GxxExxY protein [Candidatus Jacksonbacteria bacterium]MBT6955584.1 GxxExxY protein [Candidatus Jacksonbacteria bacterium]